MYNDFVESDSTAVIKTGPNSVEWAPVFLDSSNTPLIRRYGEWVAPSCVNGFMRYEPARRKRLFDTATLELV